jgi:hypothetical protein
VDCFDGLPNFNQVRPAVFDGGYAFMADPVNPEAPLPLGTYVVEAVTPPGYEHVKEEDKNVDFGDGYVPAPLLLPPVCVGPRRVVPATLSLFPTVETALGGQITRLCDRKHIEVKDGQNAAVDFFMFTPVPIAAHVVQLVTDDLNNGTNPLSPFAGEKLSMGFVPVAMHDWAGVEVARSYTDQYGLTQFLVPSTFSANVPAPSGYAPNMMRVCVNSPGHHDPLTGAWIADPWFDRTHSHTCYSFNFMPGKTTYLDTPVVPLAAFASRQDVPVDCEPGDGTPVIASVEGFDGGGTSQGGPRVPSAGGSVRITSVGLRQVPNPAWDGTTPARNILRDYGFGTAQGRVTLGGVELDAAWGDDVVVATVPAGAATGQLLVERADGARTETGVTLTVQGAGDVAPIVVSQGQSIQAAIEAAAPGQLILVGPGVYPELLVVHKPVRLQGWGAPSTVIDGVKTVTGTTLPAWRARIAAHVAAGDFELLPGQVAGTLFALEEGPAILVAGNAGEFGGAAAARIDGFTITGASEGGGILVSGHAAGVRISNNDLVSNGGTFGGGIRVGHPELAVGGVPVDAQNDGVAIVRNRVVRNGGASGVAGGIAICTGADAYVVRENQVCGNFSNGHGGGIGHLGLSDGGTIEANFIRFNQAYLGGQPAHGGGIFVGGLPAAGGGLSPGTGSVRIARNLVQGNQAATGDGGGIRLQFVNGSEDVLAARNDPAAWFEAVLENNVIVNNVAGHAGGGISLQDVARGRIVNNTIANNDSTGTSIAAFAAGTPTQSVPQPAGVVAWGHSAALRAAIQVPGAAAYSDPVLANDVIWHNRSFSWRLDMTPVPPVYGLVPDVGLGVPPDYDDLGVVGAAGELHPEHCLLSDPALVGTGTTNEMADPLFVAEYVNGDRVISVLQPDLVPPSTMTTYAAFDEGGNFLSLEYGPLTPYRPGGGLFGDYHVQAGSPALGGAEAPAPAVDVDAEARPIGGTTPDIGADERE